MLFYLVILLLRCLSKERINKNRFKNAIEAPSYLSSLVMIVVNNTTSIATKHAINIKLTRVEIILLDNFLSCLNINLKSLTIMPDDLQLVNENLKNLNLFIFCLDFEEAMQKGSLPMGREPLLLFNLFLHGHAPGKNPSTRRFSAEKR